METPTEQRRPRAVKSITGSFSTNKRPFNNNSHHGSMTLADTANHNRNDDDVVICDDGISDVMREDLEMALRSTRPIRLSSSATSGGQDAQKLVITGVRKINRNEFEEDGKKLQKVGGTGTSQRQAENDGDSSDSDVEIIEEIYSSARSRVPSTSINASARLKSPSFSLEPPLASSSRLNTGLRFLAPRPPMPPLVRQPAPMSRLLPAHLPEPQQFSRPPPPLIRGLFPTRVPAVSTVQQPRGHILAVRKPLQLPQTSTPKPGLSIPAPILAPSPIAVSTNQTSLPNLRSPVKRLIPGLVASNVVITPIDQPTPGSTIVSRPTSGATAVANVTSKAPITSPRVGDDSLPIFGRSCIAQESGIQPESQTVNRAATFNQRPAYELRRPSAKLTSLGVSTVKSNEAKKPNSTSTRTSGIPAPSVKFPEGYYGRIQPVPYPPPQDGNGDFDGLFKCDGCEEIFNTNIALVSHLLAHTLHPNSEDESLEDQTRCLSCWRDFEDPFILESHCEQVHSKRVASFACYICELNFEDDAAVRTHMIEKHGYGYELPYACKLCRYRSSLFDDIWNHYVLVHNNTVVLMCPLCLYIVEAGVLSNKYNDLKAATTNKFTAHIMKHMGVKSKFACDQCKLQFVSQAELKKHKKSVHRKLQLGEISATRTSSGILALNWDGKRPLTEIESNGQCLVSRRLQPSVQPSFTLAEADCIECGRSMTKRNHYSVLPRKCTDCQYTSSCVASFVIHKNTVHRDPALPPFPFEYSLVPKKHTPVLDKPALCACGYEDIFGNSLAEHLSTCPGSNGCCTLKETPQKSQGKSLPLMSKAMMAALKLKPAHSDDNDQQPKRNIEQTSVSTRLEPQNCGNPNPDEIQQKAKELEQQLKRKREDLSMPNVAKFLKLNETPPGAQDQPSTSSANDTPSETFSTKDHEDEPSCSYWTPRFREPSTPSASPSRPRLLNPQMALKRSSHASIPDDDVPLSQRLGQKNVPKPPSPLKLSSKLGPRLFKQYEEFDRRFKMTEAGLDCANELFAQFTSNRSEIIKKSSDDLFNFLQTLDISDLLEETPQQSTAKEGRKRKQ